MKCGLRLIIQAVLLFFTGSVSAQTWKQLSDQVDSLYNGGQIKSAYELSKISQLQAEKEFGKTHTNYGINLCVTGQMLQELGDFTQAEQLMKQGVQVIERSNTPDGEEYSFAVAVLGGLYGAMNKPTESLAYLEKALQARERLYGFNSNKYAEILVLLSVTHSSIGQYEQAISEAKKVLTIRANLYDKEHPTYGESVSSLGSLYVDVDDYVRAEPLLEEALRIRERAFGKDNLNYWYTLNNLAALKSRMGSHEQAIPMEKDLLKRMEKEYQKTVLYVSTLTLLGGDYFNTKQYEQADSVFAAGKKLVESIVGKNHLRYSNMLNGQAHVREQAGQFAEAQTYYEEAVAVCQRSVGINNEQYLSAANQLASLYIKMGQFVKADSIYKVLIPLSDQVLAPFSAVAAEVRSKQLASYQVQRRTAIAPTLLAEITRLNEVTLSSQLPYWTSLQRERYLFKNLPTYWSNLSAATNLQTQKGVSESLYQQTLLIKNLLLNQQISALSTILLANNPTWLATYKQIQEVKNSLSTQYTLPITQRKNLDSLEARAETFEKDLARQSAPFRQAQQALQVRWEDIRAALKPDEAAVEFISFPYHNGRQQTDSVRYLALVLRPGNKAPHAVPLLADETPLRQLLARKAGSTAYASRGSELDNDQLVQGDSLYQLIWHPIDNLLQGAKTVYLSPSGLLHQVSFAALPYSQKDQRYLADRYQLRQVGSTRQIATPTRNDETYRDLKSATLFGGIAYDSVGTTNMRSKAWPFLPGSEREVNQIGQIVGEKAHVVTGSAATESALKAQSGQSPTVLHIATHGFAFPDPLLSPGDTSAGGRAFQRIANPLFRTGLLMAGANRSWLGSRPALGEEDGILTAYEVANLNLSNTKLVVLSACETALGDIRGSEGVFGLQRAFKMAGAGYLLTSLWPVDDQATSDLMTLFYRNWKKTKTIQAAFKQTQTQMRKTYPPAVWAAFVLIE